MKYEAIEVNGNYQELVKELNDNFHDYELIGYSTDFINYTQKRKTTAILKCPELKEAVMCEEKRTPILNFAEHFLKLNNEEFTTIRDHDKDINVGEIVNIIAPEGRQFKAKCKTVECGIFKNFNSWYLQKDVEVHSPSHELVLEKLQEYYPTLTMNSLVWIYTLQKVKQV